MNFFLIGVAAYIFFTLPPILRRLILASGFIALARCIDKGIVVAIHTNALTLVFIVVFVAASCFDFSSNHTQPHSTTITELHKTTTP